MRSTERIRVFIAFFPLFVIAGLIAWIGYVMAENPPGDEAIDNVHCRVVAYYPENSQPERAGPFSGQRQHRAEAVVRFPNGDTWRAGYVSYPCTVGQDATATVAVGRLTHHLVWATSVDCRGEKEGK